MCEPTGRHIKLHRKSSISFKTTSSLPSHIASILFLGLKGESEVGREEDWPQSMEASPAPWLYVPVELQDVQPVFFQVE